MRIGVDFDNTIVCCDQLFYQAALEKRLIPPEVSISKGRIRDYLRQINKESDWTKLQGYVYGVLIRSAPAFQGVKKFFEQCGRKNILVFVISHKTKTPFLGPAYDLHKALFDWLQQEDFFNGIGLPRGNVFLELTKENKFKRIGQQQCTHFIDDLPEFLSSPDFPQGTERILFDPNGLYTEGTHPYMRAEGWAEIEQKLIG